ncbi:MAG: hypothetical protein HKN43_04045, partial [Rhodothermales bacterium]|nr:hypothetical protein [Rhodothermales bacterium]
MNTTSHVIRKARNLEGPTDAAAQTDLHREEVVQSPSVHSDVLDFLPKHPDGDTTTPEASSANRFNRKCSLIASDMVAMLLATLIALLIGQGTRALLLTPAMHYGLPQSQSVQAVMLLLPVMLIIWSSYAMGHYSRLKPLWSETQDFVKIIGYTVAVIAVVLFMSKAHFSRIFFLAYWSLILLLVPTCRYLTKRALIRTGNFFVPVVIFGNGPNAVRTAKTIETDRMLGLKVVAFLDLSNGTMKVSAGSGVLVTADFSNIDKLQLNQKFDNPHFVFALDSNEDFEANRQLINSMIIKCKAVTVSPPVYGLPLDGAEVLNVQPCDSLLVRLQNKLARPHNAIIKRVVDIVGSSLAMIVFSPVAVALYFLIKRDGAPVFYKQVRIGRNGKTFNCWKFRSMVPMADAVLEEYLDRHPEMRAS